jgi:hypothetical protein
MRKLTFDNMVPSTSRRTDAPPRVQEPHDPLRGEQRSTDAGVRGLYGRYVTGERGGREQRRRSHRLMRLSAYGNGTRSLHFTGGAGLGCNLTWTNPDPIVESGGFSVVGGSSEQRRPECRIFELVPQTGNTLGLKIGNGQIRAMVQSNEETHRRMCRGRWVTEQRIRQRGHWRAADGVLTGSGTHPIFTTEPVYSCGPTDGTQVDMRVSQAYSTFSIPACCRADVLVSHLHMTTTLLSRKSMPLWAFRPTIGFWVGHVHGRQGDSTRWHYTCRSPPGEHARVIEEADCCVRVRRPGGLVVLRVRINSLGTDRQFWSAVEPDGDRHMYIAREGGTDALTLHMAGRPAPGRL